MPMKRRILLPTVLVVPFMALLISPLAALAASGLPATITMRPASASPGARVEVVGLDFGASERVELQLTTTAGVVSLGTTTTEEGGYFRHDVTLPSDIAPGFWELRATGVSGAVAAHIFEAGQAAPAAAPPVADTTPETVAPTGESSGVNFVVIMILLALVGSITAAALFVYHQTHHIRSEPGMATGEDPIWSGAPGDS